MAFQRVTDTAEIDIIYSMNGATVQNVFYAALVGGYTLANLDVLAAAVDAQVQGTWKALQPIDAVYIRTEVRGLAAENDLVTSNNTNTGPGVDASAAIPNNVTLAVKKTSGFTGRSARGRTYWIGIPRDKLTNANENLLIASYVDFIVAAVDSIRTAIIGAALWTPVLVSRFAEGVQRDEGLLFPWAGSVAVDNQVDTLRGRLP